jgi:hypothetical protein
VATRDHHYVPQFFLGGFTPSGSKKDRLWESDLSTGMQRLKTPKQVAKRSDLYRVSVPGLDPEAVEQGLSKLETAAAPLLKQVAQSTSLPNDIGERQTLFYFIGVLVVRNPSERSGVRMFRDILRDEVATPEAWEVARQRRGLPDDYVAYAELKQAVETESNQHTYVLVMIKAAEIMARVLLSRTWRVVTSSAGRLVCSDRPAVFIENAPHGRILTSSDAPSEAAVVVVPLTRYVALVGKWGDGRDSTGALSYPGVAKLNNCTIRNADRYIFSAHDDFVWFAKDGSLHTGMSGPGDERRTIVPSATHRADLTRSIV